MKTPTMKIHIDEERMRVIRRNEKSVRKLPSRTVVYARVSTDSEEQKKSFDNQLTTYRQEIEANPNWQYVGSYSDEGITGSKANIRDGLQQMLADAREGKFDLIITKSLSRFTRNVKDCLNYIDEFEKCGVVILFDQENLVSIREQDKIMIHFFALGAQMESESARERTKIVFEKGIENGRVYGNDKILGYHKRNCRLVIDEYEAEIVRTIFDLYVHERLGMRRIAKELAARGMTRRDGTLIATSTIQSVLQNPKYKGVYCGGKTVLGTNKTSRVLLPESEWKMHEDPSIPVIIPPELWDEAAKIRAEKSQKYEEEVKTPCNQGKYRYSRKIVSGVNPDLHYQRFLSRYKDSRREGWQCRNYKDPAHPENIGPAVYSDELDRVITHILDEIIGNYDDIIEEMMNQYRILRSGKQLQERQKRIDAKLKKLEKARERDLIAFEAEAITIEELKRRKEESIRKAQQLAEEEERLTHTHREIGKVIDGLRDMKDKMREIVAQKEPTREMIDNLIEKIVIAAGSTRKELHLEIYFRAFKNFKSYTIFRDGRVEDDGDTDGDGSGEKLCECSDKGVMFVPKPEEKGEEKNFCECHDKGTFM